MISLMEIGIRRRPRDSYGPRGSLSPHTSLLSSSSLSSPQMSGGDDRGDLFDYHFGKDLSPIFPAAGQKAASDSLQGFTTLDDYYYFNDGMLASGPFDAPCWQGDAGFNGGEMAADSIGAKWGNHITTPSTGGGSPASANCSASSSSSMEALEGVKLEEELVETINEEIKDREPATDADRSKLKL